jgi:xanthine dehydrogenase accessory factor
VSAIDDVFPRTALPEEVLRATVAATEGGKRVVLATVIARHGSAPSTPGQKLALVEDRASLSAVGTIGGGAVERVVLASMAKALVDASAEPRIETFRLGASLGMCCGGSVDILIEPVVPALRALIVGAGHIGTSLAPLLASLGFRVTLCDARDAAADPARLGATLPLTEGAVQVLHAELDDPEVRAALPANLGQAIALVMTHDHQLDQRAIEWALGLGFGYVGGVGSRAKAVRTRERLEAKGAPESDIARVRMPIGVEIGARSPAEIAVAIAAELVAWRASLRAARREDAADRRAAE